MNKFFLRFIKPLADGRPRLLTFRSKEQILFAARLSLYLSAGIPILTALTALADEARSSSAKYVLKTLTSEVGRGKSLSKSMSVFPKQFSVFTIELIRIGETSGTLGTTLSHLALVLKKRVALKRKIVGALIYPALVVTATLAVTAFLTLYAFPKIVPLFKGFHTALPWPTRVLILLTEIITKYGWWILAGSALALVLGAYVVSRPHIRARLDAWSMHAPFLGNMLRSYYATSLARTLSSLLASGMRIVPALTLAKSASRSPTYRDALEAMENIVARGRSMTEAVKAHPRLFPITMTQLIAAGEATGTLAETLAIAAENEEETLDEFTRNLTILIEPALMIGMGLVVGFVALAIITPIYSITQNLHG